MQLQGKLLGSAWGWFQAAQANCLCGYSAMHQCCLCALHIYSHCSVSVLKPHVPLWQNMPVLQDGRSAKCCAKMPLEMGCEVLWGVCGYPFIGSPQLQSMPPLSVALGQWSPNCGLRAGYGPFLPFTWPLEQHSPH